jgi:hypothetical protein
MKVIETEYAGYRFRSRLEARWAVFFDHADIAWDYEPQGYEVVTPIGRVNYLPDFWLPGLGQYAEVKGFLDRTTTRRLLALAAGIKGGDLVVFGAIPKQRAGRWVTHLHYHNDKLYAVPWDGEPGCPLPGKAPTEWISSEMLTEGIVSGIPEWAEEPLAAARSARFEWGESG